MARIKAPFAYLGGKYSHLKWILPLLSNDCRTYVEPFCGSCAVLLNRPRARIEIANDIDGRLYNFWKVLRSKDGPELIRQIELTPRQELEFILAKEDGPEDDPVERARRYWLRIAWAFGGGTKDSTSYLVSVNQSRMTSWGPRLQAVRNRISGVKWTYRDGVYLSRQFDFPHAMIYADPPYEQTVRTDDTRRYKHESSEGLHERLVEWARNAQARVAINHYPSPTYDALTGWLRITRQINKASAVVSGAKKQSQKVAVDALYLKLHATKSESPRKVPGSRNNSSRSK